MVKIEKYENERGYTFKINVSEGAFYIIFAGNLELYWYYKADLEQLCNLEAKNFFITKENYFLYMLIDNLYENIKNNDQLKELDLSNSHKLFNDDIIDWHSDDYTYEESARLIIEKLKESYKIKFKKGRTDVLDYTFSIRMCNNGSRYTEFCRLFMKMYHDLIEYEPSNHQIHLEEYLYNMNLSRKKES